MWAPDPDLPNGTDLPVRCVGIENILPGCSTSSRKFAPYDRKWRSWGPTGTVAVREVEWVFQNGDDDRIRLCTL